PGTIVCRQVADSQIVPDGVMSPGEWNPLSLSAVECFGENDLPTGKFPPPVPVVAMVGSAYDSQYVYFVFQWTDATSTQSDLGPALEGNGSSWMRRPHRANDVNANGILDPGESSAFSAAAEDEDRLAIFFPIHDEAGAFRTGGTGCAISCHQNLGLDA